MANKKTVNKSNAKKSTELIGKTVDLYLKIVDSYLKNPSEACPAMLRVIQGHFKHNDISIEQDIREAESLESYNRQKEDNIPMFNINSTDKQGILNNSIGLN